MPQPNKIPLAFAASGDKNVIPESTETTGLASWQEGFPAITSVPFSEGGIAPKRADFNGVFNALSAATVWQQQGGFYAYDNATDYEVGNVVLYSGNLYKCLAANGPSSAVKNPAQASFWAELLDTANLTETGTFTPGFYGGTTAGEFSYSTRSGSYLKLGALCFVDFSLVASVVTVPTGYIGINGFPFAASTANQSILMNLGFSTTGQAIIPPVWLRVGVNPNINIMEGINLTNGIISNVGFGSLSVGASLTLRMSGIYRTA